MREAVIVSGARTAVGKAPRGTLRTTRADDMAAAAIAEALRRAPGLDPSEVEDVILGCAIPEGPQGGNLARIAAVRAGLPHSVPGQTVNRFCSSGLQTIAAASERIMAGFATTIVAGGAESMTATMDAPTFSPNPTLMTPGDGGALPRVEAAGLRYPLGILDRPPPQRGSRPPSSSGPEHYITMGLTAERVAEKFGVSREDQDAFALRSNQRAAAAVESGLFDPEIVPLNVEIEAVSDDGELICTRTVFRRDEGPRADTSMEALAKLPPAFAAGGSVTAGNSSQRSDGAAAVVVMERGRAEQLGLEPMARFVGFAVGGVPPELMGIGPVVSIPKVLRLTGLTLADIDLVELNEAFAAQALAVIREVGLDLEKVNVNGGAIALGHPLGATGAKLTIQLLHEMKRRQARYGMVTMCIGGGMGATGIFESLQ
jgi:acetyl-CoA acyltransferase